MRRALVLTAEAARHPFRASLPPHVLTLAVGGCESDQKSWMITASDVRGFASAYTACLIATIAFIF